MIFLRNIFLAAFLLTAWLVLAQDSGVETRVEVDLCRLGGNRSQATRGDSDYTEVQNVIRTGLMNMQESIDISKFNLDAENTISIYADLLHEDFELFFVDSTGLGIKNQRQRPDLIAAVIPKYAVANAEAKDELLAEFRSISNQIMQTAISPDLNDLGKILALHDFLCTHCFYKEQPVDEKTGKGLFDFCITAYGPLVNGEGNCNGQTMAMRHLLQFAGFKTRKVEPTMELLNHTWLQVQIDGEYYNLDASSDNPRQQLTHGLIYHQKNFVNHLYFLCSNEKFLNEEEHYEWDNPEVTPATSTRFDDYFWGSSDLNITSPIPCFGDTAYISFSKYKTRTEENGNSQIYFPIYAYSMSTGEFLGVVSEFTERWKNWKSQNPYSKNYSNLLRKDNLLLFSTPTAIMAFHPGTGLTGQLNLTLPLAKGYVYGLWKDYYGNISAILRQSSQSDDSDSVIVDLNWIPTSAITLTPSSLTLATTEQAQASASFSPKDAILTLAYWECPEDSVTVTADEALGDNVRLVTAGDKYVQTTLTATAVDSGLTATCAIQVVPSDPAAPANVLALSAGWNLVTLRVLPRDPQVLKQFSPRALDPANGTFIIPQKFELNRSYWFFSDSDTTFTYESSSEKTAYSPTPGKPNLVGMSTGSAFFDLVGKFTHFWFWDGNEFQEIKDTNNLSVGQGYLAY